MTKREWTIGEVTITVEAPDGVNVAGAAVDIRPPNKQEFLTAAEAVGGLEALQLPTYDHGFDQQATAWWRRPDGTEDTSVRVWIREPPASREAPPKTAHPFFGPLSERRDRERSPTASTEETRARAERPAVGPVVEGEPFGSVRK
jgi:hypothetical protein